MTRRIVKIATGIVLSLALGVGALASAWLAGIHVPIASGATWMKVTKLSVADNAGAPNGNFYILFIGSDLRPGVGGARGDALHLIGVNPSQHAATLINIPRDTCFNGDKVNAQNAAGGPRRQADAISQMVGVPISWVIEVDFAGFTSIIDGMGGFTVNVPTQMHDTYSGAYFSPGPQHMDGTQALAFSRDRHDFPSSDLVRTQNQGLLLLNALSGMQQQAGGASGEFRLLALFGRHAQLDGVGLTDLYRLGRIAHHLDASKIRNMEFPTAGGNCLATAGSASSLFADFRDDVVLQTH
ncbi:MAG: transcriptional attenuator, LytR family [Actinomycetia bacterium]|nr:transcriptional attenuator, LytR family [Actinomycetes bacterium]